MPTVETIRIAQQVRQTFASSALTPSQAKLYSQRIRLEMGREGLRTFAAADVRTYLEDAVFLIDCAFIERAASPQSDWRAGVKRAAEILEWLSEPSLRPENSPLHLLSAAAYQVAGYPAMALGELRQAPQDEHSAILLNFLRADFPGALSAIHEFWKDDLVRPRGELSAASEFSVDAVRHCVMAIGSVCSYFRTGDNSLVNRSIVKMHHLAKGYLHSRDAYSYLLARLVAASCERFVETTLWPKINRLIEVSAPRASDAFIQFAKSSFVNRRALVWPAQSTGIERLATNSSFVLCTPTGSGKTTVATLGIVQGLFAGNPRPTPGLENWDPGNLILYLVPSRALAAEIEARLEQDLRGIAAMPVVVTGLYGGVDWGPTDAWVDGERPTVVICTYEKADALIRYLSVLFLHRVRLVVIDEAHMVEQGDARGLEDSSSRPYRLEQLGTRLLSAQETYGFRLIALSAVAARAAPALARWLSADTTAVPTSSDYRSTRQMLGHMEVSRSGQYVIRYDLMDGRSLQFADERADDTPYVTSPFPALPGRLDTEEGPDVRMRAPTLWAALHLAAVRENGSKPTVLISLTQSIDSFAKSCLEAFEEWEDDDLPDYGSPNLEDDRWIRCLASAEDYFTRSSMEYRLLEKGVALHHGKMPGLLARRLKRLIDAGLVRVVIATSTLSEGVNIPVNYLLIPSVCRGATHFTLQEFNNLIGRAGRPGVASEGHALVVLQEEQRRRGRPIYDRQREGYRALVGEIEDNVSATDQGAPQDRASSSLAQLLLSLWGAWQEIAGSHSEQEFLEWLEQVEIGSEDELDKADRFVDSLDVFLIAAIQEVEELQGRELTNAEVETELLRIWRHTYAFASLTEEAQLRRIWLGRGEVIKALYPNAAQRRNIYRTSLSPNAASSLFLHLDAIRGKMVEGANFADLSIERRILHVEDLLELLSEVRPFKIGTKMGRARSFRDWKRVLRWWLAKGTLETQPNASQITNWYEFVASNFIYRGVWGIGSVLGLLLDATADGQPVRALQMDDWPRSGLPWSAFWLKELVTWGTLEPVAAYLLARGDAVSRAEAETTARDYYASLPAGIGPNDKLDPRTIRDWVNARRPEAVRAERETEFDLPITLARPAEDYSQARMVVFPVEQEQAIFWINPAGYVVANSDRADAPVDALNEFQYELEVATSAVKANRYLKY